MFSGFAAFARFGGFAKFSWFGIPRSLRTFLTLQTFILMKSVADFAQVRRQRVKRQQFARARTLERHFEI